MRGLHKGADQGSHRLAIPWKALLASFAILYRSWVGEEGEVGDRSFVGSRSSGTANAFLLLAPSDALPHQEGKLLSHILSMSVRDPPMLCNFAPQARHSHWAT
ncbi:hypothetical protein E2C01_047742 [Portunus trituberculatus]|uniref:Uncharacterized protein n=1 Tax=Portunus trituberculatus TaxID=210409 RepID=A0A5B7G1C6_PORTR|nr:hypothetical protein [Portunus trituberculatus]